MTNACLTPEQVRAARDLLGWSRQRLGAHCELGEHVISKYESTGRVVPSHPKQKNPIDRLGAIRAALEAAGVEFTGGDAPGVQLRHRT